MWILLRLKMLTEKIKFITFKEVYPIREKVTISHTITEQATIFKYVASEV